MNDERLYNELLSEINTLDECRDLIHQLDSLSESLFNTKTPVEDKFNQNISYQIKNKLTALIQQNNIDLTNPNAVQEFLHILKERIKAMPVLRLDVAFEPSKVNLDHIAEWIYFNLKKKILIDLHTEKDLIGGAKIGYDGKIGDFTIKKRIVEKYPDAGQLMMVQTKI